MFRLLYGELCGDLCDLAEYETYLQVTEALFVNDCKSLADALVAAGSAASRTSEDKRFGVEQHDQTTPNPQRNAFPVGRRRDDACRCSHQGQGTRTRRASEEAAAHCSISIRATSEMLEERRQARERKLLRHQKRREAGHFHKTSPLPGHRKINMVIKMLFSRKSAL